MATNPDIVVLDACVLYPAPLRDLLLSLTSAGLYQARWTRMIEDEWMTSLLSKRPDLEPQASRRTAELMKLAVIDCMVEGFEHLIDSITLPDPKDRHVLAAALVCRADAIVTFNTKDFGISPALTVLHPDDFCLRLYTHYPEQFLDVVRTLRQRLRNPIKTAQELVIIYERQGLPKTSQQLRNNMDVL